MSSNPATARARYELKKPGLLTLMFTIIMLVGTTTAISAQGTPALSGVVTAGGQPLENVSIFNFFGGSTQTNADGEYTVGFGDTPTDHLTDVGIQVSAFNDGTRPTADYIATGFDATTNTPTNIELPEIIDLTINIVDDQGNPTDGQVEIAHRTDTETLNFTWNNAGETTNGTITLPVYSNTATITLTTNGTISTATWDGQSTAVTVTEGQSGGDAVPTVASNTPAATPAATPDASTIPQLALTGRTTQWGAVAGLLLIMLGVFTVWGQRRPERLAG